MYQLMINNAAQFILNNKENYEKDPSLFNAFDFAKILNILLSRSIDKIVLDIVKAVEDLQA